MRTSATRDGDEYVLNGQKTWITNGPYADTIVLYAKLDDGQRRDPRAARCSPSSSTREWTASTQAEPMRKMGQHASPTGDVFLSDVRVGRDRLLGESEEAQGGGRQSARDNFVAERAGVAAMSLGIIEECVRSPSTTPGTGRCGTRPSRDFQLIQLKLAQMEVARVNVRNLVFSHIERSAARCRHEFRRGVGHEALRRSGRLPGCRRRDSDLGGNGYIAEYRVEQFSRDARVLRIYAGTDEMQVVAIAKDSYFAKRVAESLRHAGPPLVRLRRRRGRVQCVQQRRHELVVALAQRGGRGHVGADSEDDGPTSRKLA